MVKASDLFRAIASGRRLTDGNLDTIRDRAVLLNALADPEIRSRMLIQEQYTEVDLEARNGELEMRIYFDSPEAVNPLLDKEREHIARQMEQFKLNKERG